MFLVEDASEKYGTTVGNWDSKKKKGAELWIVMEFLSGGALTDLVTECSSELKEKHIAAISKEVRTERPFKNYDFFAKLVFFQSLKGVQYLHQQGILHRDIKSDNILP